MLRLVVIVTLCLLRTVNASSCTFISEDTNTCDVNVECSFDMNDLQNAINNHYCTEKQKLTRVLSYRNEYDYYGNPKRVPAEVEEYEGPYLRKFLINLSLRGVNFETEPYSTEQLSELTQSVKMLTIQNSTGAPRKFVNHFKKLNDIELHTDLNTIDLNMFLEFEDIKNIDISTSCIYILESKSQEKSTSFVSKIMDINLSNNFIQQIPNNCFVHFPELRNLDLSNNNLKRLEISTFTGLHNLKNLQLSFNKLTKIGHSLVSLINLRDLLIDNNKLISVVETNFQTTTRLQRLNMSSNQIDRIENYSFETLAELSTIDLSNNNISFVSKWWFENNTNLNTVILTNNKIKEIEKGTFKGKNITTFDIENNCLTGILETDTFEGLHVDMLNLSNGNLIQIKDNAFHSSFIQKLDLSSNDIGNISKKAFISLNMIEKIDISNNFLKNIDFETDEFSKLSVFKAENNSINEIAASSFKNWTSLSYLDLSCNSISKVEPQAFIKLGKLKSLALNNNELVKILPKSFFQGLSELKDINLSFTRITHMQNESFIGLHNLQILNVSHSELATVDYNVFEKTGSIQILDFSYNLLVVFHINTSSIVGITEIYLNNNQLKQISPTNELRGLVNLSYLELSSNTHLKINGSIFSNLTRLVRVNLKNVKGKFDFEHVKNTSIDVLDLSHCSIAEIDKIFVYNVADVYNLNLASNEIAHLNKYSFQTMPSLAELDLSNNLISFIQPGTFIHTNKITNLNLSGNQLSHLQFGVLDGLQILRNLNLSSNALREFSSTLLHNTPTVNTIILDKNALEDFKFSDFVEFGSIIISIGENPIPCHLLTEIKVNMVHHKNLKVKTETEDYHSENVDGITCLSNKNNINKKFRVNDTNINYNLTVASLSNAFDVFRVSIEKLNQNLNNFTYTAGKENSKILNELSGFNNQSRSYLKQLTDISAATNNGTNHFFSDIKDILKISAATNNGTNNFFSDIKDLLKISAATNNATNHFYSDIKDLLNNLTVTNKKSTERIIYVKTNETSVVDEHLLEKIKILKEEKDKIVDELKDMITEFKKYNNRDSQALQEVQKYPGNVTGILYFISVCLSIIILGFICKIVYPFVVSQNRLVRVNGLHNSVSSTQPISNVLEMQ